MMTYYLLTSFLAISIGLLAEFLFSPGTGLDIVPEAGAEEPAETVGIVDTLVNIVPRNLIEALSNADILQLSFLQYF
jgi:Na+/H+-dicarboxylate symporter